MKTTNKILLRTKNVSDFPGLNVYFISESNARITAHLLLTFYYILHSWWAKGRHRRKNIHIFNERNVAFMLKSLRFTSYLPVV